MNSLSPAGISANVETGPERQGVAGYLSVELQSSPPHDAVCVVVYFSNAIPDALVEDLAKQGFIQSDQVLAREPTNLLQAAFTKPGTGLFGQGWSEEERTRNLRAVRRVFRKHGLRVGNVRRLRH